jgi:hypothetical protein
MTAPRAVKIPRGWRRLRVGEKRTVGYKLWVGRFHSGPACYTGLKISRTAMNMNGPYIAPKPAKRGKKGRSK